MSEPALRKATYQDLQQAPSDQVAELIDGQLHLQARPGPRHARSSSGEQLARIEPFDAIEFDVAALWRR